MMEVLTLTICWKKCERTGCGASGVSQGTLVLRVAHAPFCHRANELLTRTLRYRCSSCPTVCRRIRNRPPLHKPSFPAACCGRVSTVAVVEHPSIARVARRLGVSPHAVSEAVLGEGPQVLIDDPLRFGNVITIGVDEHVWWHPREGDSGVAVVTALA